MTIAGIVGDSLTATSFNFCNTPPVFAAEGFGCTPLSMAGARIIGTPAIGATFTATGFGVPPNFTATTITFGTIPPAPTAAPSAAFVNGQSYSASVAPFSPTSPWNTKVSAKPTIATYSASVIAKEFANGNPTPVRATEPGQYDFNYAEFFASESDPVVGIACSGFCDTVDNGGIPKTMHIPAKMRVPGAWDSPGGYGGDRVSAIVQPDGTVLDFAYSNQATGDWGTPGNTTFVTGAAANCGNFRTASGMYGTSTGSTAGGHCSDVGRVRAAELVAGRINHALKIILQCQGPATVYPVSSNLQTDFCPSGVSGGPSLGARLWYDVPDSTTNAMALQPWEKAILNALHDYGGYFMDNSCPNGDGSGHCAVDVSGIGFMLESEEPFYDFNFPAPDWNPYAALASQGWTHFTVPNTRADQQRWVGADPWNPSGVDFAAHMHWLNECSARGAC